MNPNVYLCDLRHTFLGVLASDAMPLNVGYMKAVMDRDLPEARARVFVYADKLLAELKSAPPDVLMLSNYTWNEQLALHCARVMKRLRPESLVVLGGPNIHDEPERRTRYVEEHPEIDLYVLGEGDFLATEIVEQYLDAGMSVAKLLERDIPSSVYRRPDGGETVHHEIRKRQRNLDDIPSPWLTGVMDEFFDGRLAPLWETNRGCPFTCTFCVQGTGYYNRVSYFGKERLREEIQYIGRQIEDRSPSMGVLRIADPNYGMYRRDPDISRFIGEVQRDRGWPTYVDATTGKNRPDRVIESMEAVSGALVLYQSVQSLDEDVLRRIKRQNIKLEAYEALQVHMRGRGLKSSSDIILGLPGETLESHLDSVLKMVDSGVARVHNFQCLMLKGTELERQESRDMFQFRSGFRLAQKSFGVYDGEPVFDVEEFVVSTESLDFDDYLKARTYHFICGVYINHGRLETLFRLAEACGIRRSQIVVDLVNAVESDDGDAHELLQQFLTETRNEVFSSREELAEYYRRPEQLERLKNGEVGDNLIYKYSSIAGLRYWSLFCRLALDVTRARLLEHAVHNSIPDFETFWRDFEIFLRSRFATGTTIERLTRAESVVMRYDVEAWSRDEAPLDLEKYRLGRPTPAEFRLSNENSSTIKQAVDVWGLSQAGATMLFKRIPFSALERRMALRPPA